MKKTACKKPRGIDEKIRKSRAPYEEAKKVGRDVIKRYHNILNEIARK